MSAKKAMPVKVTRKESPMRQKLYFINEARRDGILAGAEYMNEKLNPKNEVGIHKAPIRASNPWPWFSPEGKAWRESFDLILTMIPDED